MVGTLRRKDQLEKFNQLAPGKTIGKLLDVTHFNEVDNVVEDILKQYGHIDVLVNNAGYKLVGAIEEVNLEEAKEQLETNFFGALNLTQKVLPFMRSRNSGHIIQISSVGGFASFMSVGIYNASKYAVEGFSEALAQEVKPFHIKVTIVEPGAFRTEWAGTSMQFSKKQIPAYDVSAGKRRKDLQTINGKQPGDPNRAAQAILTVVNSEYPSLRLPLGIDSIEAIERKIERVQQDISQWREVSVQTTYSAPQDMLHQD